MSLYDLLSGLLTFVGYAILVYRIVHLLERGCPQKARMERLCTKWLVFAIFLRVEEYLLVVFDILPLGKILLLLLKLFLFMPENSVPPSPPRYHILSTNASIRRWNISNCRSTTRMEQ